MTDRRLENKEQGNSLDRKDVTYYNDKLRSITTIRFTSI